MMLPQSKSYTVVFAMLQLFSEIIIKSSENNKMRKGGKEERKSCRIRINYFTEQSNMTPKSTGVHEESPTQANKL